MYSDHTVISPREPTLGITREWLLVCSCVQKEEKERALKYVHVKNAKLSIGGRLLVRKALVQLLQLPNNAIRLSRSDKGKPLLCDPVADIHFNVSHDGNYVVLAAERSRKVGVDVMQINRPVGSASTSQFFHQMRRQFTEQEWKQILYKQEESEQLRTFFRLWCLKESYIKAIGTGIGMGLQRIDFTLSSQPNSPWQGIEMGSTLKLDGALMNEWIFEESYIDSEHCVCVATVSDSRPTVAFNELQFDEIVRALEPIHSVNYDDWEIFVNK